MSGAPSIVFLLDVDNTLLDNDRVHDDIDRHLAEGFGGAGAKRYWAIYEELRDKLGYADYLGAVQRFRLECGDEVRAQERHWQQAGIHSVPAAIVNRQYLISGGQPPEVFEQALREIASKTSAA